MDFPDELTVNDFSERIRSLVTRVDGNGEKRVRGLNVVQKAREGDVTFADDARYVERAVSREVAAIITTPTLAQPAKDKVTVVVAPEPFMAFKQACEVWAPPSASRHARAREREVLDDLEIQIAESAVVDPDVILGERCRVDRETHVRPGVYVGADVRIGANCFVHPNVVLEAHTRVGDGVTIGAGTVIGSRPNAYKRVSGSLIPYSAVGHVEVADDVEIGAICTVDRCLTERTIIGPGCRIGNGVQIGHGASLGSNVLVIAHVAIGGESQVGEGAIIQAQSGVDHDIHIGREAIVRARSGVTKSIGDGEVLIGNYGEPQPYFLRRQAALRSLPDLRRELKEIIGERRRESEVAELAKQVIASQLSVPETDDIEEKRLDVDFHVDSLDVLALIMQLEDEFEIAIQDAAGDLLGLTIAELANLVKERVTKRGG